MGDDSNLESIELALEQAATAREALTELSTELLGTPPRTYVLDAIIALDDAIAELHEHRRELDGTNATIARAEGQADR